MNEELVRENLLEIKERLCEYIDCMDCPMYYGTHNCDDEYVVGPPLEDLSEKVRAMVAKICDEELIGDA